MALRFVVVSLFAPLLCAGLELKGPPGVVRVEQNEGWEVLLKTQQFQEMQAAKRAADVNVGLIVGLYVPKKNPYEGEVTSLIKCDSKFAPVQFEVKCPASTAKAVVGGVGERKAFGMCTKTDIKQIGIYFACENPTDKTLTEVRAFRKFSGSWDEAVADAKSWAERSLR